MLALPRELCRGILAQAASDDPSTAHTLAFVSRSVCAWTSLSRWRTIVITRLEQLIHGSQLHMAPIDAKL